MIIVARNRVGEKTCAWNATAGEPYSCMDCGAKMHVTRKEGHDFFACFPGERHTTAHCIELSSQNRLHSTRRFDYERFFEYILEDTTQNNVHGNHPEMRQAAQDQQNGAQNAYDDLTFTSLKQMWDEGLIYRSAAMQLGNRRLISVLVSNRMTVDWEHDHINGPRIIQCRPEGFFQNERNNIMYCKWMRRVTEADKPFWEVKRIALNFAGRAECENVIRQASVYKGYKRDKIEMRDDRAETSDFPLYLNTVAGGLDCRNQAVSGFSFVVKINAIPVIKIIG